MKFNCCISEELHYAIKLFELLTIDEILWLISQSGLTLPEEFVTGACTVLNQRCPKAKDVCLN